MKITDHWRGLSPVQRNTFIASFLGWTLDAFDFFLVPLLVVKIATDFNVPIPQLLASVTATLLLRPVGALIFGMLADRFGRRGPLMLDILLYAIFECATAFAPTLTVFIILRALYGVAMGGEWGLGAALALESLPSESRGFFSGILQQGYACGFLAATLAVWLLLDHIGWRGMFIVGILPAFLVIFIRAYVPESPAWLAAGTEEKTKKPFPLLANFTRHWPLYIYAIFLMTAFNYMSHGTQDLYPTFLQQQRGLNRDTFTLVNVIANIGAIIGGVLFGTISQRIGRRKAIGLAVLLGIFVVPLWTHAPNMTLLALGGFLVQFCVQGAWGIIPAHLNELSPADARASFPGLMYQLGNFLSAGAAWQESVIAKQYFPLPGGGNNYAAALSVVATTVFVLVGLLAWFGPERRTADFTKEAQDIA